jgi:CBS domain-containing protein
MASTSRKGEGDFSSISYQQGTVAEAMRAGVISCQPETPLRKVAQMMAEERIHCIIVSDDGGWGAVTDVDLLRAVDGDLEATTAGEIAASDLPTVSARESLERAGQLMVEHEVSHVLVVDPDSQRPAGVLSTLDVAGVLGWGRTG